VNGDPADLDARIAEAEAIATDPTVPPNLRADARRALERLREYRNVPASCGELLELRDTRHPAWVRDPGLFVRLIESDAVVDDGSGTVAVRWDLIRKEDRPTAYSYLNVVVDTYRNRPVGGRPKELCSRRS
jgi:hypothetical protein